MAIATVGDLEFWIGRIIDDTDAAQQAIDIASSIVITYCNHSIEQVSNDVIVLDGNGTNTLLLPAYPVTNVDSIEVDGEALDPDDYKWSSKGWIKRVDGLLFPNQPGIIEVTYDHGYASVPDAIKGVVLSLAARINDGSSGIKQETIGSYSVTYGDPSPVLRANEQAVLDAFKVVV